MKEESTMLRYVVLVVYQLLPITYWLRSHACVINTSNLDNECMYIWEMETIASGKCMVTLKLAFYNQKHISEYPQRGMSNHK